MKESKFPTPLENVNIEDEVKEDLLPFAERLRIVHEEERAKLLEEK